MLESLDRVKGKMVLLSPDADSQGRGKQSGAANLFLVNFEGVTVCHIELRVEEITSQQVKFGELEVCLGKPSGSR